MCGAIELGPPRWGWDLLFGRRLPRALPWADMGPALLGLGNLWVFVWPPFTQGVALGWRGAGPLGLGNLWVFVWPRFTQGVALG
ncbi:hypothetical protein CA51_35100 [Rosistilla oblonga]|nr:hypothetical protein CA51_35100 [Rosistilla oblonga]